MTKRYTFILSLISSLSLIYGCHLDSPSTCFTGQHKCENSSMLGYGIASTCGPDGQWHQYSCMDVCSDDGQDCKTLENIPDCAEEGASKCIDVHSLSISFMCVEYKWIPCLCETGAVCKENMCSGTQKCEDGAQFCAYIDEIGASVSGTCLEGTWTTYYCPEGVACDGDACASHTKITCDEHYSPCNGVCVDKLVDVNHCGECGHACTGNNACIDGNCQEPTCDDKNYLTQTAEYLDPENTEKTISTEVKAYCIDSPELLYQVRDAINNGEYYPEDNTDNAYILMADLDLEPASWIPIGTYEHPFEGAFFGNQKTIRLNNGEVTGGVTFLNNQDNLDWNVGFFGYVKNALIDDIKLFININMSELAADENSYLKIGGLIVNAIESHIKNVSVYPKISFNPTNSIKSANIGGMIGVADRILCDSSKIEDAEIVIKGKHDNYIGGVVGSGYNFFMKNSEFEGTITIDQYSSDKEIGGIVGECMGCIIDNCSSSGTIQALNSIDNFDDILLDNVITDYDNDVDGADKIGGISGLVISPEPTNALIKDAHSSMTVSGKNCIGGLVGSNSAEIQNSYATGDVWGYNKVGGLVGHNSGVIENSYATGAVNGIIDLGGLVGNNSNDAEINNSYASGNVDGKMHVGGFVGAMKTGSITSSYATGNVTGHIALGGFIGVVSGKGTSINSIKDCYSAGDVNVINKQYNSTLPCEVGGFVGDVSNVIIENSGAFGNVNDDNTEIWSTGGFAGVLNDTSIEKCFSMGRITGLNGSGFVGKCDDTILTFSNIMNSYALTYASSDSKSGDFMAYKYHDSDLTIDNCYYHDNKGVAIVQGSSSSLEENLQKINFSSDNTVTVYGPDGTTPLADLLGEGWTTKTCKLDIGDGEKDYVVPISTTIYPDICH